MRRAGWFIGIALTACGCAAPNDERIRDYNQEGVRLYQQADYTHAQECFQAASALKPNDLGLLYNLGQCSDRLGDNAKAESYYNQVLQQSPNHTACRHALASLLVREGRMPDAAHMVQDWLASQPHLAAPYAEDGWLYHQAGDLPRAQARLQQALQLDPHNAEALVELGLIYESMQRPDRALVLYQRSLADNPHQPDVVQRVNYLLTQGAKPPKPDG